MSIFGLFRLCDCEPIIDMADGWPAGCDEPENAIAPEDYELWCPDCGTWTEYVTEDGVDRCAMCGSEVFENFVI